MENEHEVAEHEVDDDKYLRRTRTVTRSTRARRTKKTRRTRRTSTGKMRRTTTKRTTGGRDEQGRGLWGHG